LRSGQNIWVPLLEGSSSPKSETRRVARAQESDFRGSRTSRVHGHKGFIENRSDTEGAPSLVSKGWVLGSFQRIAKTRRSLSIARQTVLNAICSGMYARNKFEQSARHSITPQLIQDGNFLSNLFSHTCAHPRPQTICFDILPQNTGGRVPVPRQPLHF
jgi:hypothetical protein